MSSHEPKPARSLISNFALILISGALLTFSFNLIQAQLTTVNSVDAIVNGVLTDLRTPEEGVISKIIAQTGKPVKAGDVLFVVENKRISQLQVQEVSSRLNQQTAELEKSETHLVHQLSLLDIVSRDAVNQKILEISENKQNQNQLESDREGAKARFQLAKLNYERAKILRSEGVIAEQTLDVSEIELKQRESEVKSLVAKIATIQVNQDAVRNNLSLSKTRSNFDPGIRLEELQLRIAEEQQGLQTLRKTIQGTKAVLDQAKKDLQRRQFVTIKAPESGVMWRLTTQLGKFVPQGESLAQIVDCNQRWVDAWVDEQKVQLLPIGTPAEIQLIGTDSHIPLTGKT